MSGNAGTSDVRGRFASAGVTVVRLLAAPRSGKTSIILATIDALRDEFNIAVVQGDAGSTVDAGRIRAQGIPAVQAKPLEGEGLEEALGQLDPDRLDLVIVEAPGAPVSAPDFGWGVNVVVFSAAEGAQSVDAHAAAVKAADAVILNKVDSLAASGAGAGEWETAIRALNPDAPVFALSATKGVGVDEWAAWLSDRVHRC